MYGTTPSANNDPFANAPPDTLLSNDKKLLASTLLLKADMFRPGIGIQQPKRYIRIIPNIMNNFLRKSFCLNADTNV